MDETTAYLPGLSPVENKEVCARFDGGRLSSDGGVLVLREIEKRLGLAARLAGCLTDVRDPASTTHSYADMIGGRMFAIACGSRIATNSTCCASIRCSSWPAVACPPVDRIGRRLLR